MRWYKTRPSPEQISPFGLTLQLSGAAAVLTGLYLVYPPLAYLIGGGAAIIIGEKV